MFIQIVTWVEYWYGPVVLFVPRQVADSRAACCGEIPDIHHLQDTCHTHPSSLTAAATHRPDEQTNTNVETRKRERRPSDENVSFIFHLVQSRAGRKNAPYIWSDAHAHMGVIQPDSCIHHSAEYSHSSSHVLLAEFCISIGCEVLALLFVEQAMRVYLGSCLL